MHGGGGAGADHRKQAQHHADPELAIATPKRKAV